MTLSFLEQGLWPNYVKVVPSIAIAFVTYEQVKSLLHSGVQALLPQFQVPYFCGARAAEGADGSRAQNIHMRQHAAGGATSQPCLSNVTMSGSAVACKFLWRQSLCNKSPCLASGHLYQSSYSSSKSPKSSWLPPPHNIHTFKRLPTFQSRQSSTCPICAGLVGAACSYAC